MCDYQCTSQFYQIVESNRIESNYFPRIGMLYCVGIQVYRASLRWTVSVWCRWTQLHIE